MISFLFSLFSSFFLFVGFLSIFLLLGLIFFYAFTKHSPGPSLYHWAGLTLGHRGCRMPNLNIPENSLLAFDFAYRNGADGVECDVYLTKDNEIIIMHDETIDRMLEGRGRIEEFTLAEIQSFCYQRVPNPAALPYEIPSDLKENFPWVENHKKSFNCPPTLEQLIVYCETRPRPFKLMIETKEWRNPRLLHEKLVALYKKYPKFLYSSSYVACFNPIQLYSLRCLDAEIPVCYLYCRDCLFYYHSINYREMNLPGPLNNPLCRYLIDRLMVACGPNYLSKWIGASSVGVQELLVNGALIEELYENSILLDVWTVNNYGSKQFLLENGALITTDRLFTKELEDERRIEKKNELNGILNGKRKIVPLQ